MATSRAALPVMSIYGGVLWLAMLTTEHTLWPNFVIFLVNVYCMVELNNRNALMRQYSRMVSCSYIAMMMMCPWLFRDSVTMTVQLCFIAAFSLLFHTYQNRDAMGSKYWAYLFLGIAAVFWPPTIYFLPLFWIAESSFLMSFSWKALGASLFGVVTPLWLAAPYIVYAEEYSQVIARYHELIPGDRLISAFHDPVLLLPQSLPFTIPQVVAMTFILLVFIIGIVHYLRNSYSDKIHVRMLYHFFILIAILTFIAMLCVVMLPFDKTVSSNALLSIGIVCVSPLLAHFVAFTYTRLTNIMVIVLILAVIGITAYEFVPVFCNFHPLSIPTF